MIGFDGNHPTDKKPRFTFQNVQFRKSKKFISTFLIYINLWRLGRLVTGKCTKEIDMKFDTSVSNFKYKASSRNLRTPFLDFLEK